MCGIVCIIQDFTSSLLDLKPPFRGHHTHYIRHRVLDCIFVLTPTLSMIHQPLYVWYHIKYMWDILSTIFMTWYPLCMTSLPCLLTTPQWAYVWHHLRYRSCHIHCIRPSHSLYDFTFTSGMTSHQLYLCHHNLSIDITPILYDITPTICVTSYALYIATYSLFMSLHYSTYDSKTLTYETTSSMQLKIYTIYVTSQSLICVITHTVLRASHPLFVWHHTLHRDNIFCTIHPHKVRM